MTGDELSVFGSGTDIDTVLAECNGTRLTIPDGGRPESQLVVQVESVAPTPLSDAAPVVTVSDRNGDEFDINIWESHETGVDWQTGHWYVLTAARGYVWRTDAGELRRRLATTSDLEVRPLGPDVEPEPVANPPEAPVDADANNQGEPGREPQDEDDQISETPLPAPDDIIEEAEEGSLIDDITDEFDIGG